MAAPIEAVEALTLRNIEVGPATPYMRADPSPADPGRRSEQTRRTYRLSFSAERPGVSATFVIDVGWDGRAGETNCPVEDLEELGKTLVKEFASHLAHSN
jgi:hypothetical protein